VSGDAPVGVLELLDRQGAPTFSLDDMQLLGWFAELTALVLELRRAETSHTILVGQALTALTGLPEAGRLDLEDRLAQFVERAVADPAAKRTLALAEQVAAIGRRGEAEQQACAGVLAVFSDYLDAHPAPGFDLDALR
jgi:GAF domain-containing protein